MNAKQTLAVCEPAFSGTIGAARRDITPPVGIYSRMWGSATHDVAEGIHRPLMATALTFRSESGGDPFVLVGLDLGWWRTPEDEWFIRGPVLDALKLDPSRLIINLAHTHSGPSISLTAADKPGGDKVEPYMRRVSRAIIEAIGEALELARPAKLSWGTGRCDLARDRQLPNPEGSGLIVGYNPDRPAEDTVLVGRVTDVAGRIMATIVNYACHPTTLGGGNKLISPDYVGAMREVMEASTGGAPCLYLHGAAGELAPRRQYASDAAVADQNGRHLGFAAVSVLHGMLPPGKTLAYSGIEGSGAELGRWELRDHAPRTALDAAMFDLPLPLKPLASLEELTEQLRRCTDRVLAEKLDRAWALRTRVGNGQSLALRVWLWRLGNVVFIGTPAEGHSPLQTELRRRFPNEAVVVMNIVNGYDSYLPPRNDYATNSYQAQVAIFESGCLETLIEACMKAIATSKAKEA